MRLYETLVVRDPIEASHLQEAVTRSTACQELASAEQLTFSTARKLIQVLILFLVNEASIQLG